MRTTNPTRINSEFLSRKNWKEYYQWKTVASKGNTEIISDLLIKDFYHIGWTYYGLRQNKFFSKDHLGYCELKGGKIDPFNEKRFCRAIFNEYNKTPHSLLGLFWDYEIPLTAQRQNKDDKLSHGDIDLLSCRNDELLFIEAKIANNKESLLKAILEIFVYVMRLKLFDRLPQFLSEYNIKENFKIIPCILTDTHATSGKQLLSLIKNPVKHPNLLNLINKINTEFKNNKINELEYYIVEEPDQDCSTWLNAEMITGKNYKITFTKGIQIKQCFL